MNQQVDEGFAQDDVQRKSQARRAFEAERNRLIGNEPGIDRFKGAEKIPFPCKSIAPVPVRAGQIGNQTKIDEVPMTPLENRLRFPNQEQPGDCQTLLFGLPVAKIPSNRLEKREVIVVIL